MLILLLVSTGCGTASPTQQSAALEHEDYVPDERTATAIAEAISRGQLGERQLTQIVPFEAHLVGELWRVTSRIGLGGDTVGNGGFRGVTMDIQRNTGEIVFFGYYPFD